MGDWRVVSVGLIFGRKRWVLFEMKLQMPEMSLCEFQHSGVAIARMKLKHIDCPRVRPNLGHAYKIRVQC